jgi:colanic acid/amylovoran/stewartan biosynthesis glycosyltransferase WcaL/AmsK/CpsK
MSPAPPVSFFLPRFPSLSETFIQAQVEGLLERGCEVEVVALAVGDPNALGALLLKWGERLKVRFAPVARSLVRRIAAAPRALFGADGFSALDAGRFGDDAASLRLLVASARWPLPLAKPRAWLAHYGRWGRFACALRELGHIRGPIATVFHGKDMSAYLRHRPDAFRTLFERGDLFLPISEFWRDKLSSMGAPADRILVHRMGVDVSRFRETPRRLAQGESVRFIGVGRMVDKKGFDDALGAFAQFRAAPDAPSATLTLIGDGPLRKPLQARARRLGLGQAVRFTGKLPHASVAEELTRAHAFVLASKTSASGDMEGIPVALMEAMAQGLPVLATRHSGTPELVEHNVSGLLCDEADVASLAANMGALARAPRRWAAMGEAGAAKVRAEFDLARWNDTLLERLDQLYAEAMTKPRLRANQGP